MRIVIINPKTRTVTEDEWINGDFGALENIIGCGCMGTVTFRDKTHVAWVDDNGLYTQDAFFNAPFYPGPLAGVCVITGMNEETDIAPATLDVQELADAIVWMDKHQMLALYGNSTATETLVLKDDEPTVLARATYGDIVK